MIEPEAGRTGVAVVGDVIGSRRLADQAALQRGLADALEAVERRYPALQPFRITVGDEFQGLHADLPAALGATLLLRLLLDGTIPVRCGLGLGAWTLHDPERAPFGQSGTAWWNAREALDALAALENRRGWPRSTRTRYAAEDAVDAARWNAYLLCRDHALARMDARDRRIALGLFRGETQESIAEALAISQPSVSRRQMENGPAVLFRAQELLAEAAP